MPDLGGLGAWGLFTVLGPIGGAAVLMASHRRWLPALLDAEPWAAGALLLLGTVVLAGASLVPTHASSLLCGMALGGVLGSVLALAGVMGAAALGHRAFGRGLGSRAAEALARQPRAQAVHAALIGRRTPHTVGLLILIRLSPVMPFAATNLLMAAAGVRLPVFLTGSVLGLAPRVILVTLAGAGLAELDLRQGRDGVLLVVGLIATLAAILLISRIAARALRQYSRDVLAVDASARPEEL